MLHIFYLQMPEKESENEPHPDAHDPSRQHECQESEIGHGPEDGVELWHGPQLHGEDFGLGSHVLQLVSAFNFLLLLGSTSIRLK